jgi:hypothetical protein
MSWGCRGGKYGGAEILVTGENYNVLRRSLIALYFYLFGGQLKEKFEIGEMEIEMHLKTYQIFPQLYNRALVVRQCKCKG